MTKINSEEREDSEIPKQVLDNFVVDEDILFNLKTRGVSRITTIMKYFIQISTIGIIFEIFIFIILKGVDFILDIFGLLILLSAVIVLSFIWLIFSKTTFGVTNYHLIITNKAFYLVQSRDLERIDIFSIKAIILRKKKSLNDFTDTGIIDFIWDMGESIFGKTLSRINRTTIESVPDASSNLKVIESIILHYGNIYERWEKIKGDMNITIPCEFKSSKEVSSKLNRRIKIYNISQLIYWIFLVIGFIFIFTTNRIVMIISILVIVFSSSSILSDLIINSHLRRFGVSQDNTVYVYNDEIILVQNGNTRKFNYNPNLQLDFRILQFRFAKKDYSFVGIIKIKLSPDSSIKVKLGPYKDYLQVLEIIYLIFLFWKNEQKLLRTKEQLLDFKEMLIELIDQRMKTSQKKEILTWQDFQNIPLDFIEISNDKTQDFRTHLNPNEQILIAYKPLVRNQKIVISSILFIIGLTSLILLFFPSIYESLLLSMLFLFPGTIFTIIPLIVINSELGIKKDFFLFTDQKFIAIHSKKYRDISYDDISSVILYEKKKTNTISINLKPSFIDPLEEKVSSVSLTYLTKESNLYEKILFLKSQVKKEDSR